MKKIFCALILGAIFLGGCAVPGTYMAGNVYNKALEDHLLRATLIPVDSNSVQKGYLCEELCPNYQYHIGPYDQLNIVVWNHPEMALPSSSTSTMLLNNTYTSLRTTGGDASPLFAQTNAQLSGIFVDTRGNIVFPLIGDVQVAGLTTYQAKNLLSQKLSDYIRQPKVSVQVMAFNSQRVNVVGEVVTPGSRALTDRPMTILDAINLSGGINNMFADTAHIYVFRGGVDKNVKVYWLKANSPQSLLLAERFHLANNDIVFVSTAGVASWNKVVSQILPTVQTVWNIWSMMKNS